MSDKKVIVILGATGAQGGGLAEAILNDPQSEFSVRAVTRNTESDKARDLAAKGAELVDADVDSQEKLNAAFEGAYGVYAVTFFWEHFSAEKEQEQVRAIVDAAKQQDVKHVVWSTLEDTRNWVPLDDDRMPTLGGKYKVPHFDGKGESNKFFTNAGVPTTFMNTSFYWDNLIHFGMGPKKGEDGKYAIVFPMGDKKLPGIAAEDIGKCAYGVFKNPDKYIGATVGIAGEHVSGADMAKTLADTLNMEISYYPVEPEVFRGFGFPGADDLGNMFQFKRDFNEDFCNARSIDESRSLNPGLLSFKDWAEKYKDKIPLD